SEVLSSTSRWMPSLASSAISTAISEYSALTCHIRWTRRHGPDPSGTRVQTIPDPLATSIAAARAITYKRPPDTSTPTPARRAPARQANRPPLDIRPAGQARWTSAPRPRRRGQHTRQPGGRGAHPPAARTAAATPEACFVATSRHQDPETNQEDSGG